ncbi:hypothetical protein STCU_11752 [Strigomonas culicis]|uniref:Uncharacterized protein n=1 Tax=Strigomonas culicis TaxID=28005 RepID=S9THJ5_9TRYP|nr:hypothetical protein STCU_11752 [Strigomonas culicis]|eukprot:EPY15803.1 hypothetical protein STCU_11752 [Strigomonas culicis]
MASLEEALGREVEKKEQAALCLERDEEERRRRFENDLNEKKRSIKQIEIEQRRRREAESELKAQQDEIESIKQCIHRRH